MGMVAFYLRHMPMLSVKLSSLYVLLKKNVNWFWGEEQQGAFNKVKLLLAKENVLHPFDPEAEILIITDACQDGFGAVLCYKVDGSWHT